MSLFEELESMPDVLPALNNEEDLLFGGGDLFEFAENDGSDNPGCLQLREAQARLKPDFFPFDDLDGLPSKHLRLAALKKIDRTLHSNAVSAKEEATAERELEGAISTLSRQIAFLKKHQSRVGKWTSTVFGSSTPGVLEGRNTVNKARQHAGGSEREREPQLQAAKSTSFRSLDVSIKCEGQDDSRCKRPLIAHVQKHWFPHASYGTWRGQDADGELSVRKTSEDGQKRARLLPMSREAIPVTEACGGAAGKRGGHGSRRATLGLPSHENGSDDATSVDSDVADVSGKVWAWLEEKSFFDAISRKEPLPKEMVLEAAGRIGRVKAVTTDPSLQACHKYNGLSGRLSRTAGGNLQELLLSALMLPGCKDGTRAVVAGQYSSVRSDQSFPQHHRPVHMLDVAQLNSQQRTRVQLRGIGLDDSLLASFAQSHLSENIAILNAQRINLRMKMENAV